MWGPGLRLEGVEEYEELQAYEYGYFKLLDGQAARQELQSDVAIRCSGYGIRGAGGGPSGAGIAKGAGRYTFLEVMKVII